MPGGYGPWGKRGLIVNLQVSFNRIHFPKPWRTKTIVCDHT